MKDKLQFIMEGGSVTRYHTRPGLKPDTNAHHSHGVLMLASLLAGLDEVGVTKASVVLLMACATHDLAEQYTSDVSAPAKRALGVQTALHTTEQCVLREYGLEYEHLLSEDEKIVLSLADCFDGMLYCCRELALGNRSVLLIWRRYCTYAESITQQCIPQSDLTLALRASAIYDGIKEIYKEVISASGPNFDVFACQR